MVLRLMMNLLPLEEDFKRTRGSQFHSGMFAVAACGKAPG